MLPPPFKLTIIINMVNQVVMSTRDFEGTTYSYLRALSLTDLCYLLFVIGYYVEVLERTQIARQIYKMFR